MAKPGRKPLAVPRIPCRFNIRADLLAQMELLLLDPVRDKPKYAARSDYVESLIEKDLAERRRKAQEPPVEPLRQQEH